MPQVLTGKVEMLNSELMELEQRVQRASEQARDMINDLRAPQVEADAGLEEYIEHPIGLHRRRGGPPVDTVAGSPATRPTLHRSSF